MSQLQLSRCERYDATAENRLGAVAIHTRIDLQIRCDLTEFDELRSFRYHAFAGWSSLVARRAHNPLSGIGGSNPASAKWASAQQCAGRSLVKVGGT
jgi:hypothetical protein